MAGPYGGIKKPTINTSKSSDRRLASARQPAKFLHSSTVTNPQNVKKLISTGNQKLVLNDMTVKREGGGKQWNDDSLLEWDPKHFRLFVGNLGTDANDALLISAFGKYESLSKVKVPIDKKSGKNKGYGFVAFSSSDDYLRAFREMNGKYVGQHPVQLKRAEAEIKPAKRKNKGRT